MTSAPGLLNRSDHGAANAGAPPLDETVTVTGIDPTLVTVKESGSWPGDDDWIVPALRVTLCLSGDTTAPGVVELTLMPMVPTLTFSCAVALSVNAARTPEPMSPSPSPAAASATAAVRIRVSLIAQFLSFGGHRRGRCCAPAVPEFQGAEREHDGASDDEQPPVRHRGEVARPHRQEPELRDRGDEAVG